MKPYTLVAIDAGPDNFGNAPDLDKLKGKLGDSLMGHETIQQPHWRTGDPQDVHRFTVDPEKMRNTHAHGHGYRSGFIVHIED